MTFFATPDTPGFRLRTARKALSKSQEEFGTPMGYGKAPVSTWETGRVDITILMAQAIELNWGIRWQWLLYGKGDPWSEKATQLNLQSVSTADVLMRPEIDGTATCGPGGEIYGPGPMAQAHGLDRALAEKLLKESGGGREDDLFFLRCAGHSMEPTINDQELVLINADLNGRMNPRNNAIYLVRRSPESNDARVKRIRLHHDDRQLVLASDNRTYATTYLDLDSIQLHQLLLGRVCWVWRSLLAEDPPESEW